jgi:hypothetical protein
MEGRINVSRQSISFIPYTNVESLGASYTHVTSLKGVIGNKTKKIVMYHAFLNSLEGFEDTCGIEYAYLGFNRIYKFRPEDKYIPKIDVLDLSGNPITSLENCPQCRVLIVSSTLLKDLQGCPDGVEIIRCGHSTHLKSLKGLPRSIKLIECSCSPNLKINKEDLPEDLEEILTNL